MYCRLYSYKKVSYSKEVVIKKITGRQNTSTVLCILIGKKSANKWPC